VRVDGDGRESIGDQLVDVGVSLGDAHHDDGVGREVMRPLAEAAGLVLGQE